MTADCVSVQSTLSRWLLWGTVTFHSVTLLPNPANSHPENRRTVQSQTWYTAYMRNKNVIGHLLQFNPNVLQYIINVARKIWNFLE